MTFGSDLLEESVEKRSERLEREQSERRRTLHALGIPMPDEVYDVENDGDPWPCVYKLPNGEKLLFSASASGQVEIDAVSTLHEAHLAEDFSEELRAAFSDELNRLRKDMPDASPQKQYVAAWLWIVAHTNYFLTSDPD